MHTQVHVRTHIHTYAHTRARKWINEARKLINSDRLDIILSVNRISSFDSISKLIIRGQIQTSTANPIFVLNGIVLVKDDGIAYV